jgi:hypothetical protein
VVDGVEIKATLSGAQIDAAVASFGLRPADAKRQVVYFFDVVEDTGSKDPSRRLRLFTSHVILRVRQRASGKGESTLKLRPADRGRLTGRWAAGSRHDGKYRVEYDWAAHRVLAASMDADLDADRIADVVHQRRPVGRAFTAEQEEFLDECGSAPSFPFRDLHVAGPIEALRWEDIETGPFTERLGLRAEQWKYEGGFPFLELSVKVDDVEEAGGLRDALAEELRRRNLRTDPLAETKTETVLRTLLGIPAPARTSR